MTYDLSVLSRYNTPTVANAIELFELRPRNEGFLKPSFFCLQPSAAPIAGFAATCTVSGQAPESFGKQVVYEYWEHLESIPAPRISVVHDLDPQPGTGCFWGEVNANIHLALGCAGTVTNGAARDLDEMRALGFQALYRYPAVSHAYIHATGYGKPLIIDGTIVKPNDLIQIDQHGALLVPVETLPHLEEAVREIERRERPVIEYCQSGRVNRAELAEVVTKHMRNAARWNPGGSPK